MADIIDPTPTADPTPTDPPTDPPADDPPSSATDDPAVLRAEIEKWKSQSRRQEDRAKANANAARELEELKKSQQTDAERAVAEAEQRGRAAVLAEYGQRLAAAEIKAALAGIVPDPALVLEDLNLARYVTETGDVNTEAVDALKARWTSIVGNRQLAPPPPPPPGDGGARGGAGAPGQLSAADVDRLRRENKHAELAKAHDEGRLNQYLGLR